MPRFASGITGPTEEEIGERFSEAVVRADEVHQAIDALAARLENAKARTLAREKDRLTHKHGADSAASARAASAVEAHAALLSYVSSEAQKSRIPVSPIDEKTLRVHGRAVDANGAGIVKLEARLVDGEDKTRARARTDDNGYFRLDVTVRERAARRGTPATPVVDPATGEPPVADAPAGATFQLTLSRGTTEIHREEVRDLVPGQATYRELVVDRER